ncbi:MAG TPA: hypothetical protein DHV16_03000 [Nitrospiraceae bacterium]|nr:MAG: hypothetical protein A2Z82_10515 [Nitrospirae bacterium GWA2_46_11]OGW24644.1 MAG: hypothetical protein A2X55_06485 [Nitrospirae bacterium GWB2_47_37]HAK88077.1 hypothetical protein [Nitrospiraceae bacterium]HCZ11230.1 hypothetical protein [Nitrospiraceae bacterium]
MREMRFKITGTLFYTIVVMNLFLTEGGQNFIHNIIQQILNPQIGIASSVVPLISVLLTISALLFTSDAIGYVFSSIVVLWWNFFRGESYQWHTLKYDLKQKIIQMHQNSDADKSQEKLQLSDYYDDVVFNYFWQQAPEPVVEWTVRRDTAFLIGLSAALGIAVSVILSAVLTLYFGMIWTGWNWVVTIIFSILMVIFLFNAWRAGREEWQMMSLWSSGRLDGKLQNTLQYFSEALIQANKENKPFKKN